MSAARVAELEFQLAAYRRAINQIDDRIEYRQFTKADIAAILNLLTETLRGSSEAK